MKKNTNKFELTEEVIEHHGHTLHRIKALKDFSDVEKGDMGGWIEGSFNLSQEGNCWIFDNAKIYGNAEVYGDAEVYGNSIIRDNAKIYDNACIGGNSIIRDNAKVYGKAHVFDHAWISGGVKVCGEAKVWGYAVIVDNAEVKEMSDYMVFQNNWSSGRNFTWTKSNDMWTVGCFYGTGEELIEKAYKDSEESGKNYEKYVKFVETFK